MGDTTGAGSSPWTQRKATIGTTTTTSNTNSSSEPWNAANADAMTVDSWGGGTQLSAFPPLVAVPGQSGWYQCPTHPEHRTTDPASFCPLCEVAWESQRRELRAKRQSVEEQLQNLQSVDSAAAILQDLQVSMKDWKPQAEPESSAATPRSSMHVQQPSTSSGRPPYPPFSNGQGQRPQQQQPPPPPPPPPPMPAGSAAGMAPASFFSPFYDQSAALTTTTGSGNTPTGSSSTSDAATAAHMGQMQAFAMQLQSVQRMQDWMLYQKEQECQQLRQALEERRSEVQQLQVDKALLQEKLYQQEERMKHELKLIKLAALQQQQQSQRRKSGNKSSSGTSGGGTASAGASATTRDNNNSSSSKNQGFNGPIVVLPDHMLQSSSGSAKNEARMVTPPEEQEAVAPAPPQNNATWEPQPQSAFGTPMAPQQQPVGTAFVSPSDQKEQETNAAATGQSEDVFRQESHEESVKSIPSASVSKESSSSKRRAKAPGSWIVNRKTAAAATTGAAAGAATAAAVRQSVSSPVDTDDFVDDVDDHAPDDIQQQPSIPTSPGEPERVKDGYGTDDSTDDDTSFHRLVANANSNTLPDGSDLFSVDESTVPKAAAPIQMFNAAATSSPPRAAKKETSPVAAPKTKDVSSPSSRGVSFPDTADQDDNASLGNTVASSTFGEDRQKVADQTILDPYGDRGTYTGIILRSTGMPHGPGRMIYQEDRRTYDGEWRHGRWHGYGRATFANGDTYQGEYRFDQRHGRGRYQWSDGRIYDGMFREDRRHGRGTFTWPDGAVYEGEFRAGQREGQGSYQFSDGGRYEGSWKDGRYNGYGVCKWEDGRCYKGEWLNGMAHGKGIETFADGSVRHDGQWIEDEPV